MRHAGSRKRKPAQAANHERWLVSYADFITLLFAFFVVMFASSQADKGKAKLVSQAVEQAFTQGARPGSGAVTRTAAASPAKAAFRDTAADLSPSLALLRTQLSREIQAGEVKVDLGERGLVVSLSEAGFFHPGDDRINPAMYSALEKVSASLLALPNPIRLEGHTDSVPIHNSRFRSNWDLSTARALAVLTLLEEKYSVSRGRLSASGYADTAPADSNETEAGRAHNRRVDLVILSGSGMAGRRGI